MIIVNILILFYGDVKNCDKAHCPKGIGTYEDGGWIKVSNFKYGYIN